MKSIINIILVLLSLCIWIPSVWGYSHDFKAITQHQQMIPKGMLEVEIIKRQAKQQNKERMQTIKKIISDTGEQVNQISAPITNSGDAVKAAIMAELSRSSRSKQIKMIKRICKVDSKKATSILQRGTKGLGQVAKHLDHLDKSGALASAAGALSGGDIFGALETGANTTASGAIAGAGAVYGAQAGGAVGGLVAGPPGAVIGGGIGAVTGAIGTSVAYNEYLEPQVTKIGDYASKKYQEYVEEQEVKVRRIRVDFHTVYPGGRMSEQGYIDPKQLRVQAQAILDQRNQNRWNDNKKKIQQDILAENGILLVPDLTGKTKIQAEGVIRAAGFSANVAIEKPAPSKEFIGKVYTQIPAPKTTFTVGSFTTIIALVYGEMEKNLTEMPSVIGMNPQKARGVLKGAGLTVPASGAITVGKEAPEPKLEFKVFSQQPEPGKKISIEQTVALVLYGRYQGKTVPSVIGLGKLEATLQMEAAGLQVSTTSGASAQSPDRAMTVQSQSLTAGKPVLPEGGSVILTIYGVCEKSKRCRESQSEFYGAYQARDYEGCRQILDRSQDCAFHDSELAALNQIQNHQEQSDFCQQQLAGIDSALRSYKWDQFKGLLAQSKNCSFYSDYLAMAQKAEKRSKQRSAENKKKQKPFNHAIGQIFSSALHSALSHSIAPPLEGSSPSGGKRKKRSSVSVKTYQEVYSGPRKLDNLSR